MICGWIQTAFYPVSWSFHVSFVHADPIMILYGLFGGGRESSHNLVASGKAGWIHCIQVQKPGQKFC